MRLEDYIFINGVYRNKTNNIDPVFETQYLAARKKEARLYDDETIKMLPYINSSHPLYHEWMIRKESAQRLIKYCRKKQLSKILEVGCGNGWLSNMLAEHTKAKIIGIDVNLNELEQASRVFKKPNLCFIYDELISPGFLNQKFDLIIFAASIQYFPSLRNIIALALQKTSPAGEIHILDSFLYSASALSAASKGSEQYYQSLEIPGMVHHYFHHTFEDLQLFHYEQLYNPRAFINKAFRYKNPFPWFCIKK